jgi:hypothetical protein
LDLGSNHDRKPASLKKDPDKDVNEFLKQVRNGVEKHNKKEKERTKTAAPKTHGGHNSESLEILRSHWLHAIFAHCA